MTGPLAAAGFTLLDEGASIGDLVKELEITPAEALDLETQWATCQIRSAKTNMLREVLALNEELIEAGWSCGQVRTAYAEVTQRRELLEGTGWTDEAALDLLRIAADRFATFEDAAEALDALPGVEDLQDQARFAQDAAARAHAELRQARQQLKGYAPFLALGATAAAFSEFVRSGGENASALLRATDALPGDLYNTAEILADRIGPEAAASARKELAGWVVEKLDGLLVLRSNHEQAVNAARERDRLRYVALGMMSAGGL